MDPCTKEEQAREEISENNKKRASLGYRRLRKMWLIGFIVTGLGWPNAREETSMQQPDRHTPKYWRWPRPTQGPEESKKSPKEHAGAGPQKSRKSAVRSLKRVRTESKSQVLDSFRTRGALFRLSGLLGPAPGYSFQTLFRLFQGSRAPVWGWGQSQPKQ